MEKAFSGLERKKYLKELSSKELDILIIGGGITGAGIALDAISRGYSAGLIEMQDFAAGTSSRSTKLVHGGLRYLKQLEIKLVSEVGKERAIVYENAPHVTTPEWMLLPIIKGGTFGKFTTSFGLKIYDYLAQVKKHEKRRMLNREQTIAKEPLIRKEGLKGSGLYAEYRTDDARLTIEVLKKAVALGATAVNYAKVEKFLYENGKVVGVVAQDLLTKEEYHIRARKVVNATGPWVDTLRKEDRSKKEKYLHLTKGTHIVIDQSRFPLKQAVYFDTPKDGRMIFAIPRQGKTYIGTTDTTYVGDLANPHMTEGDLNYILNAVNYMFPDVKLTREDVESSWAGLRPLIHEEGKTASEISRKDEIFISESGLLSIAGGKLTGYRKMAEKIVDLIEKQWGTVTPCKTAKLTLAGGDVGGSEDFPLFVKKYSRLGEELGLGKEEALKLTKLYGSNVKKVYKIVEEKRELAKKYRLPKEVFATLFYGIEDEMVVSPVDFFNRRTGALLFNIQWVKKWKKGVLQYMSDYFQWSNEQIDSYRLELERAMAFAEETAERVESKGKNRNTISVNFRR
ncbi:glycerol-3-phosphate dehydrogenase [Evansella vedderi]|uniref:Glycerol-3-phosphate dehydrogenase n=1 Tax=Evansella vedderi TaxID=38282 RepID=A0ABU0A2S8_9BACI|nr:glycerol-3-phosphate dehydrogenase/oxidase [Evansella vedderi]MDQ0257261.1 glycerol-3-phosphate dehydrogenase [Evansella vedderi]